MDYKLVRLKKHKESLFPSFDSSHFCLNSPPLMSSPSLFIFIIHQCQLVTYCCEVHTVLPSCYSHSHTHSFIHSLTYSLMALSAFSLPLHLTQATPSDPKTSTPLALSSHSHWAGYPLSLSQHRLNQVRTSFSSCEQFS